MTTDQKFISAGCLLVGLVIGFMGGRSQVGMQSGNSSGAQDYKAQLKARVIASGMVRPQMPDMRQLAGTIKSVNGKTFTLALTLGKDPFGDPALDERTVAIDSGTKISLLTQKDVAVFQKEMMEFQSALQSRKPGEAIDPSKMPTPPQMFVTKIVDVSALKVGDTVSVTTKENVKEVKSFPALTVDVRMMNTGGAPGMPATLPPANTQTPAIVVPPPAK